MKSLKLINVVWETEISWTTCAVAGLDIQNSLDCRALLGCALRTEPAYRGLISDSPRSI